MSDIENYRKDADTWLENSMYAGTPEGQQLYLLHALVRLAMAQTELLVQIRDAVSPQVPDTIKLEGYGDIRVFKNTDEIIDSLYRVASYPCSLPRPRAASPQRERRVVLEPYGAPTY
jgi:hypothetical protein